MQLEVYNINGEKTGRSVELSDDIFGLEPNDHVIYLSVKQYLANQRQGTHKSKEKWEISGSTRKLKKQKGTGTARAGSIKSGVFVGGGRIFGPRPRNYSFALNKKVKNLAKRSALSHAVVNDKILVIEDFSFDVPKTKEFRKILINLGIDQSKVMVVLKEQNKNVYLSGRNLPRTIIEEGCLINTYDILNANKIVLTEGAIQTIK